MLKATRMIWLFLLLVSKPYALAQAAPAPAVRFPGAIGAAAYSPAGNTLAMGGYRAVWMLDAKTGRRTSALSGPAGMVTSLAYSPDGSLLAAAGGTPGKSGGIQVWNVRSSRLLLSLTGPMDVIYGLAFRPDGKQIAGCSYDHSVTLWTLPQTTASAVSASKASLPRLLPPTARLRDHTDAVYAVAYSPDGTRLASAGGDRTVKVWDVPTGKRLYTLSDSTGELYTVAFRPDGKQLAAAGVDKALRVWNLASDGATLSRSIFAHEAAVLRLLYTHNGRFLLSSGEDNAVKRWNADTLDEAKVYPRQSDWPQGLAVSPSDTAVAVGCHDGSFQIYPLAAASVQTHETPPGSRTVALLSAAAALSHSTCSNSAPLLSDTEIKQAADNDLPARAQPVPMPVTIRGTLWNGKPNTLAPAHFYRFSAQQGKKLIVDVMARRAGSPLDSEISICDLNGHPLERAVLRAIGRTEITLFDKDSVIPGIRLLLIPDLHLNDYVLIGRELLRIGTLPKGPDDDYQFRSYRGQRVGYLGTTPEYHTIGAAVYKVEIHPPGSRFSPNGMPLTHLYYRNDDGGPLYGRDSYLEFEPPASGDYLVRITDSRGQQGDKFSYRLNIHPPRPDFKIVSSPAAPAIPQGGGDTINLECERYEGFGGEIAVRLEGLPTGFTAVQTMIETGENGATLQLSAAANAESPLATAAGSYRIIATARINGQEIVHTIEPDEKNRRLKVNPPANVSIVTDSSAITLRPGHETTLEARIERKNGFLGRVPLEVRNLPFGVKIQDVGLNGVLITEKETVRKFVLYCEPWVKPQTRMIFIMALPEGQTGVAAPPVTLTIRESAQP